MINDYQIPSYNNDYFNNHAVGALGTGAAIQNYNPAAQALKQATNETGAATNKFQLPDTSKVLGGN